MPNPFDVITFPEKFADMKGPYTDFLQDSHRDNGYRLYMRLDTHSDRVCNIKAELTQDEAVCLINTWARYLEKVGFPTQSPHVFWWHLEFFCDLLMRKDLVTDFVKDERNAKLLTAIACTFVSLIEINREHHDSYGIPSLLKKWLNQDLPMDVYASANSYVDFMHGPGVWPLYIGDVENPLNIGFHLYKNHAPLCILDEHSAATAELHTKSLPENISM